MVLWKGTRLAAAAVAVAFTLIMVPGDGYSRPAPEMKSATAIIDAEMERRIVLRSVRMPERFGRLILEVDADLRRIDRKRQVEGFADADVWVIGLSDWTDIDWLESSPLYTRFANRLQQADPAARFKSFQWRVATGRQLDLHFVNLENVGGLSDACLAEMVYTLTNRAVAHRRVVDLSVLTPRARPLAAVNREGVAQDSC